MVPVLCRPKQVLDEEEGSDTLFIVGVLVFVSGVTVNGVLLVDKVIVGGVLSLDVESEREIVSSKVEAGLLLDPLPPLQLLFPRLKSAERRPSQRSAAKSSQPTLKTPPIHNHSYYYYPSFRHLCP